MHHMIRVKEPFELTPVGIIHLPFHENGDVPQSDRFSDADYTREILPEFT
jgi:tRNA (Thr-GGU) A37 N-methylase